MLSEIAETQFRNYTQKHPNVDFENVCRVARSFLTGRRGLLSNYTYWDCYSNVEIGKQDCGTAMTMLKGIIR